MNQAQVGADLVVGAPLSLTGIESKDGALAKQGYDLWVDWVNGHGGIAVQGIRHRLQVRYQDDQSRPDVSGEVAQQLVTDQKARFLLGSYGSSNTAADAAVAERNGVPLVATNGSARGIYTRGYHYVFSVESPAEQYLQSVLDMSAAMRPKPATVALLSADDGFSVEVSRAAAAYTPTLGMSVVFDQQYPSGSTNLYAALAQVKAKQPDILLNSGHLIEAIAINKAARDLRLDARILAYSAGPSTPDFARALGRDANYVYSGSQWSAQLAYRPDFYLTGRQYVAAYGRKYGSADLPAYQAAAATAGGLALQKAIENANSLDPAAVRASLARLDMMTFFGRLKFDAQGMNTFKPMVVEQIQDGKLAAVWPPSLAPATASYPTPAWDTRTASPAMTPALPAPKAPATGRPFSSS
jgi:branched-chain amino acid transport system substrate-binding protein